MSTKSNKKGKKPLQTSLGKAATQSDKDVDLSHVQKPIHTNIFGLHQVLSLFQTGTKEVQNYVMNECDIMYECRICRTIFRSLANFILHKRNFCKDQYGPLSNYNNENLQGESVSTENVTTTYENHTAEIDGGLASIVQKLKDQHSIKEMTQVILNEDLSKENEDTEETSPNDKTNKELLLEEIATNNAAVFQTLLQNIPNNSEKPEYIRSEIMEIHGILDNDEAVLGPDGKICNFRTKPSTSIPRKYLICPECNMKFSTKKTLIYHVKYKHNNTRLVYVCPDCKDTFANAWCVYRHLYKIHRRTTTQIRRLREQIHNSVVRKDQEPLKKREKKEIDTVDEENQWLNNIEGDKDFQMCGGCGKRFERKAALHSHAQMCTKRIAVCNTIKVNNKRKEEVSKDKSKTTKVDKPGSSEGMKGASKRKPYLLRTYKTAIPNESRNICDVNANSKILNNDCDISSKIVNDRDNSVLNHVHSPLSDELHSPDNYSPVEQIDTEKMFTIIGVNTNSEIVKNSNIKNHIKKELTSSSYANIEEKVPCETVNPTNTDNKDEENIKTDITKSSGSFLQKLLQKNGPGISEKCKNTDYSTEPVRDAEEQLSVSSGQPSNSTYKISLRKIDELMPASQNTTDTIDTILQSIRVVSTPTESEGQDLSNTIKANVSPKVLRKVLKKPIKRKRRLSLDVESDKKVVKLTENDSLWDEQDINFISKASPYMDQNNLSCYPCKIKYSTLPKLLWHMSAHFSWFRFQCSRCSFISFSKADCTIHARIQHNIKPNVISSVVLPIPNWKIALMSHDFCKLDERHDLSGRHTDENILTTNVESIEVNTEDSFQNSDVEYVDKLFADSDNVEIEVEDAVLVPYPILSDSVAIKNNSIDIIDEVKESFQVDLPSEIYSPEIYETLIISNIDDQNEIRNMDHPIFITDSEDLENEYFVPKREIEDTTIPLCETIPRSPERKIESIVKEQINYKMHMIETKQDKSPTNNLPNDLDTLKFRPKRNRFRSVKTLQNDFVYEMNKVFKGNESPMTKQNIQKQKKTNNVLQKTKVPVQPNLKDTKECLKNK